MKPLGRAHLVLLVLTLLVVGSVSRTPVRAQPLEVVDANGTKIGSDVIGVIGQLPRVAFNLDGRVFALLVTQTGFFSDHNPGLQNLLVFASPDCSGPPFVEDISATVELPLLLSPVAVAPPGQTVYLPVPGSSGQNLNVGSVQFEGGFCPPVPAESQPFTVLAVPAQGLLDLSTQFVPPFRVQLVPPSSGP
jgi:hypothetical protein